MHSVACCAIAVLVLSCVRPGVAAEPDVSEILNRVRLIPLKERGGPWHIPCATDDFAQKDDSSDTPPAATTGNTLTEACSARFSKWTRHEDEFLSFLMPDDPRVRLEIKSPDDPIPVQGSPVRSSGIDFFRCYQLTFKDETYCLLLLDRQSEFDESICFCGEVVFEKYLMHHDAVYRFSLMENGKIKKIQVLGDGLRLVLFEWTHMPIAEEVYAQIALSVQWRRPPQNPAALAERVKEKYGKTGFLEKGMDRDDVVALLGQPTNEDGNVLRYAFRHSLDEPPGSYIVEWTWKIPLIDGRFLSLAPDWSQLRNLAPERNSVQWVLAKLEGRQGESDSVEPAREDELRPLLARCIELLPEANELHWQSLCRAACLLAQRGVKDPRVPEIIEKRYLDPNLWAVEASEALREYDAKKYRELLVKRIRLEMVLARHPDAMKDEGECIFSWTYLTDLIGLLSPEYDGHEPLIEEATNHPHASIRHDGYSSCLDLPTEVARPLLRKGIHDPRADIRVDCAWSLQSLPGSEAEKSADLAILRDHVAKEKDEEVIRQFNSAIEELETN